MSDQPDQNDQHNQHNQDERLDQPIHPPASPLIDHASLSVTEAHADPEDLVLYAMQFLNREQTSAVAAHVAACAECREELARVQGDLATTALTTELDSLLDLASAGIADIHAAQRQLLATAPAVRVA